MFFSSLNGKHRVAFFYPTAGVKKSHRWGKKSHIILTCLKSINSNFSYLQVSIFHKLYIPIELSISLSSDHGFEIITISKE